ncbi:MAG: hypothetical protein KAH91_01625 [Thermoplasmatales archaeon]|nr:hypothetical protein [Thermoplasmatales archaeon]
MDLIPLIYMKNRKIHVERKGSPIPLDEFLNQIDENKEIYFLDIDGIEKDKPNLCTYQRLSGKGKMWVDVGPHTLGDVTDLVMAGATSITIRKKLFPIEELVKIEEMTESKIYIAVDLQDKKDPDTLFPLLQNIAGLVVNYDKKQIEMDFDSRELLRKLCNKYSVYAVESEKENIPYWEKIGVKGVLLDFSKAKNEGA